MQTIFIQPPLLALGADSIVGLIVFVVMIISWIAQALGGQKNAKGAPRQRMGNPARPQQNQLQEGIELFKKMVAEQQQQNRQKQNAPGRTQQASRQSSPRQNQPNRSAPPIRPAQEAGTPQKKSRKEQTPKRQANETKRRSLGDDISRRHIPVETDLARHVVAEAQQSLSKNSIADQIRQDLQNNVAAEVTAHLGTSQAAPRQVSRSGLASSLRTALGNRSQVAQAIVLSEILQPPVAMRKKA